MKRTVLSIFTPFLVISALAQGLSVTPNQPIGEGKGIFPGRVVWAMDPEVAKWDGTTGRWWDEGNIDMALLGNMYEKSICALAGSDNVSKAWDKIFKYHNKTHLPVLAKRRFSISSMACMECRPMWERQNPTGTDGKLSATGGVPVCSCRSTLSP